MLVDDSPFTFEKKEDAVLEPERQQCTPPVNVTNWTPTMISAEIFKGNSDNEEVTGKVWNKGYMVQQYVSKVLARDWRVTPFVI